MVLRPKVFEKLSATCQVLFGWVVVNVGTPIAKLLKLMGGTVCGNPAGPDGMMPREPAPVANPKSERLATPPWGWSVVVETRRKLRRNSFTALGPSVFTLLIKACCPRDGVVLGNPGTLADGNGLLTVESSKW